MTQPRVPELSAHGMTMPVIGYGTMEFPQAPVSRIAHALKTGYRHIDTARKYGTEPYVGEAIKASGLDRASLFVTTKVTELDAHEADFMRSVETSLKTLQLSYVDLLLVHWPQPKVPFSETLGALAKAKRQGLARHIGVSNFTLAMLEEAAAVCPEPLVTNQIEYHPYLPQTNMLTALRRHGMILTAYCPLARGELVNDPVLSEIGRGHGKTAAQVALRWLVQQPMVAVVPRALEDRHIEENLEIFDFKLTDDEMERVSALRARRMRIADPPERAPVWDVEPL